MLGIVVTFLASFLIWFLFLGLFVLWFIDGRIKKEQVLHAIFAVITAWLVTAVIKDFVPEKRPYAVNANEIVRTVTTPHDNSFPSTHTAVAFALSMTIFMHDKKVGAYFFAGSMLVAVGRVMASVHYPIDVIAGSFLGVLIAYVVSRTHMFGLLRKQ